MRKVFLIIAAMAVNFLAMGQVKYTPVANTQEFTAKLVAVMQNMNTMQSGFTQVKHNVGMATDLKSNGNFFYMKSDKVCLNYETPVKMSIVVNGSKVMMKTASNKHVLETSSNPVLNEMVSVISSCMTGNVGSLKEKYRLEYFQTGTEYLVKVFPNDEKTKKIICEVDITLNKSTMYVSSMKMIEATKNDRKSEDHDFTEYIFTNTKINSAVSEGVFAIK